MPTATASGSVAPAKTTGTGNTPPGRAKSTSTPTPTPTGTATATPAATATPTNTPSTGSTTTTFSPAAITFSDPEIGNPTRGAYRWYDNAPEPSGWPAADSYMRFTWRQVEPTQDNYQWSLIDPYLSAAASRGGTFGMRIMPADSWNGGTSMPDYLMNEMPGGFWFTYPDNGKLVYAPDWNSTAYMSRAEALIRAIAARYANDPRFGWIEIGPWGDWSEWHVWHWPYTSTSPSQPMTLANRQHLIDMHVQLFPPEKLVQMIDSADLQADGVPPTLGYALSKSPLIGIRSDCFGTSLFDTRMGEVANLGYGDRWKTARIVVEYCNAQTGSGEFSRGLTQVTTGHVSLVEGNHGAYSTLKPQEQADFNQTRKQAGYRLRPTSLSLPGTLVAGSPFTVSSLWANDGVAPPSHQWQVQLQLRNPSTGAVAWQGTSALDPRTLLPTTNSTTGVSTPVAASDTFTLAAGLVPGSYDLVMVVQDPGAYYPPLALAIQGRAVDGSYRLGSVTVQ